MALIVLGAFIAGARDLSFDSYGYAVVFLANVTTAIYLATIARIGNTSSVWKTLFSSLMVLLFTVDTFIFRR